MEKIIWKDKLHSTAHFSLFFNIAYSIYHMVFGVTTASWWFLTIGIYYAILSVVRYVVLQHRSRKQLLRFTGSMLILLSVSLVGTVILAFIKDRGTVFHLITMLAIATYTFTKIVLCTAKWIKARKNTSPKMLALRNISFADALVSILSLQRSMLVSFEGMAETEIRIMNVVTGSGVCVVVFLLGLHILKVKQQHSG